MKPKLIKRFRKAFPRGSEPVKHVLLVDALKDVGGCGDFVGVEKYLYAPGEVWISIFEEGSTATAMLSKKKALRLARAIEAATK